MDIILLEHVSRLGNVGDVVTVKDGYGRNFLLPQKKAVRATKDNIKEIEAQRDALEKQNTAKRDEAQKQADSLKKLSVKIIRQASDDGRLFGSVATRDVVTALKDKGHNFERQQIDLSGSIKYLGLHEATITLHPEVKVVCKLEVVRTENATAFVEEDEADDAGEEHAA